MTAARDVQALLQQLGMAGKLRLAQRIGGPEGAAGSSTGEALAPRVLPLPWPELVAQLPDEGLPCGGVVELTSPDALGGATSVALAAVRAGQARGKRAWCAWIDPEATLHAPGLVAAGVDLRRLLVVRAPRAELPRMAVKVVQSGAFEVVAVDFDAVPEADPQAVSASTRKPARKSAWAPEVLVRKLALAAEPSGTTVLLLTDSRRPRALPWPVALRIELSRPTPRELAVRVAKDKRGRIGIAKTIFFPPAQGLLGSA